MLYVAAAVVLVGGGLYLTWGLETGVYLFLGSATLKIVGGLLVRREVAPVRRAFCSNCGSPVKAGQDFCGNCGERLP